MNRRQLFAAVIAWAASLVWKPPTKLRIRSCSSPRGGGPWIKQEASGAFQYNGYHFIPFNEVTEFKEWPLYSCGYDGKWVQIGTRKFYRIKANA